MAYLIVHFDYGLYLGSNQRTRYWSKIPRPDLPPAVQTFETIEAAVAHITSWCSGNIPSAYTVSKIEDHGSGYVFEEEAVAKGYRGWLACICEGPLRTLKSAP
ncbi:MAG: hypothetical protein AAF066_02350 [Pseudomonadota bacterium]